METIDDINIDLLDELPIKNSCVFREMGELKLRLLTNILNQSGDKVSKMIHTEFYKRLFLVREEK